MPQNKPNETLTVKYNNFHTLHSSFPYRQPQINDIPITTKITAVINKVSPYGQILADTSPSPKATVSSPQKRRSLKELQPQNFCLRKKAPPFTEIPVRVIPVYTEMPKSVPYLFSGVYSTISAEPMFTRISARSLTIELLTPIKGEPAARFC